MKKSLQNLQDALAYLVNQLYDTEKKVLQTIGDAKVHIASPVLRQEIEKYAESSNDKLTKLERIFNYLMEEPHVPHNEVVDHLMEGVFQMITHTSDAVRDVMIISCFQHICHNKIAGYGTARSMALELELETVGDLLSEIVCWEKETDRVLTRIALLETNLKAAEPSIL